MATPVGHIEIYACDNGHLQYLPPGGSPALCTCGSEPVRHIIPPNGTHFEERGAHVNGKWVSGHVVCEDDAGIER